MTEFINKKLNKFLKLVHLVANYFEIDKKSIIILNSIG